MLQYITSLSKASKDRIRETLALWTDIFEGWELNLVKGE